MEYDADGNFVSYVTTNIEDIQAGDLVYSYNTQTGEVSQCEVTQTYERSSDHINNLTVEDENGIIQTIETTDSHPFWVLTDEPDLDRAARSVVDENGVLLYHDNLEPGLNGYWVEAKDLQVGDVFLGANGELSTLTNIVRVEQEGGIAVFNFEVEGNHNYFILAKEYDLGQTCVLVHNADVLYRMGTSRESANRLARKAAEAKAHPECGIHGVSVSTKPNPNIPSSSASRKEVETFFPVHNTPRPSDPSHKTVELPEPVTPETARVFNSLFGRPQ